VGVRVWVERRGQTVLGDGRAELLGAIGRLSSISAAAKAVGMSYRRAWNLVQEVNQAAGEPLVESAVGGPRGGGAKLTPRGQLAISVYEQLSNTLRGTTAGTLRRILAADPSTGCLHLAAAISLQDAIGELLTEYALHKPTVRVRAVFGASNELADHLLGGAPGDLFITADAAHLDRLEKAGLLDTGSRRMLAANGVACIAPAGKAPAARTARDLADPAIKRIVLAEPACPLGDRSREYLQAIGVYDAVLPKVIHVDNARAVLTAVQSGAADAALALASDAATADRCQTLFHLPVSRAGIEYAAAVVHCANQPDDARDLLDFLASPTAARCFRRCGLRPARKLARKHK